MKLTNKQLDLVTNMIYDKVQKQFDVAVKNEEHQLKAKATAIIKASPLYKKVENIFKDGNVESVSINSTKINQAYPWGYRGYSNYSNSAAEFLEKMVGSYYSKYKTTTTAKQDIENKVLLSMLDAKDLNTLIETIANSFLKK